MKMAALPDHDDMVCAVLDHYQFVFILGYDAGDLSGTYDQLQWMDQYLLFTGSLSDHGTYGTWCVCAGSTRAIPKN